jgi:hypothetical protein
MVFLKRQFLLWGYTLVGVVLLLIAGLVFSFWVGSHPTQLINTVVGGLPLVWWRTIVYAALLLFWSKLVTLVIHNRQQSLKYQVSRGPLVILIILYECLIVQNPLSVFLRWVG